MFKTFPICSFIPEMNLCSGIFLGTMNKMKEKFRFPVAYKGSNISKCRGQPCKKKYIEGHEQTGGCFLLDSKDMLKALNVLFCNKLSQGTPITHHHFHKSSKSILLINTSPSQSTAIQHRIHIKSIWGRIVIFQFEENNNYMPPTVASEVLPPIICFVCSIMDSPLKLRYFYGEVSQHNNSRDGWSGQQFIIMSLVWHSTETLIS